MKIEDFSIFELSYLLRKRQIRATEIVERYLSRIEEQNGKLNAYITVNENALDEAKKIDELISRGEAIPPYAGIPIAVKDNINIEGMETTCASEILRGYVATYDATAVRKLREKGFIFLGKTNMDEFAMGSSTEFSAFGPARNPHDPDRVAGGSSGGSAVAVAAKMAHAALGSDTGGSIRLPASFTGVYGLKPTYGRVSRFGLVAYASSLDQIGPIARNVEDIAILLSVISGWDEKDSTTSTMPVSDFFEYIFENREKESYRIALPEEYWGEGLSNEVREVLEEFLGFLRMNLFRLEKVSLPHTKYAIPAYYIIATAEASSNLGRFDGVRYGQREPGRTFREMIENTRGKFFGEEVKRRILLGTFALSTGYYEDYYLKAQKARTLIINDFKKVFEEYDFVLAPTSPTLPFKIGEKVEDPLKMYLSDIFTVSPNLAGLPALNIPVGFSNGLPVGIQLIGNYFSENRMLKFAYFIEKEYGR